MNAFKTLTRFIALLIWQSNLISSACGDEAHTSLNGYVRLANAFTESQPFSIKYSYDLQFDGQGPSKYYIPHSDLQNWFDSPLYRLRAIPGPLYPTGQKMMTSDHIWKSNVEVNYQRDLANQRGVASVERSLETPNVADECSYFSKMGLAHASNQLEVGKVRDKIYWLNCRDLDKFVTVRKSSLGSIECWELFDETKNDRVWVSSESPYRLIKRELIDTEDFCPRQVFEYSWKSDVHFLPDSIKILGYKGAGNTPKRTESLKLVAFIPGPFEPSVFHLTLEKGTEVLDVDSRAVIRVQDAERDPFQKEIRHFLLEAQTSTRVAMLTILIGTLGCVVYFVWRSARHGRQH